MVVCAGCDRPILDRFLLNVLDRAWHAKCVTCTDCKANLTDKCFSRDGKLYCRDDFFRRFGTKCGGCGQGISPNDLVRRARNKVFHLKCFTCMVCRKQLSTGEELYVLDENKFICKEDYLSSKFQESEQEDMDNDLDSHLGLDKMDDGLSDKDMSMELDGEDDSRDSLGAATPTLNGTHTPIGLAAAALVAANTNTKISQGHSNSSTPTPVDQKPEQNNNTSTTANHNKSTQNANNTGKDSSKEDTNSENDENSETKAVDEKGNGNTTVGAKRRGPRTTIKAKQLETLKAAFAATPKPTRHIREQLAQETGLNMRVIQVWFQNRRSKERRMKQLSALGARRHFFRNPRRMRALRPGELDDNPELMGQPGFYNFSDNGEFYPGYPGYGDYFPDGQGGPGGVSFLPPNGAPGMPGDQMHPGQLGPDGQFMPHSDMGGMPPNSSPEPLLQAGPPPPGLENSFPPRSLPSGFQQQLSHGPPPEMQESW